MEEGGREAGKVVSGPNCRCTWLPMSLLSEGDNLFRSVLTDPEDDAPRLVWADWLEEHGKPDYAAWIREQITTYHEYMKTPKMTTQKTWVWFPHGQYAGVIKYFGNTTSGGQESLYMLAQARKGIKYAHCRGHVVAVQCNTVEVFKNNMEYLFSTCPIVRVLIPTDTRVQIVYDRQGIPGWKFTIRNWNFCDPKKTIGYRSRAHAARALNLALVNRGRQSAGLPDLAYSDKRVLKPVPSLEHVFKNSKVKVLGGSHQTGDGKLIKEGDVVDLKLNP